MSLYKQYLKEIKKELGYNAAWRPNFPIILGDVGTIKKYEYSHRTSLDNEGITFVTREGPTNKEETYKSRGKVSLIEKASGQAPLPGTPFTELDAGVTVKFSKEGATVYHLFGCKLTLIDDIKSLGNEIMTRYKAEKWDKNDVVVTQVISAQKSTILISESRDSEVHVRFKGGAKILDIDLVNLANEFERTNYKHVVTNFVAEEELTPMFKAHGIKRSWWPPGKKTFVPVSMDLTKEKIIEISDITIVDSSEADFVKSSQLKPADLSEVEVVEFGEISDADLEPKSIVNKSQTPPGYLSTIIPGDVAEALKLKEYDILNWEVDADTTEEGNAYVRLTKPEISKKETSNQ